MKKHRTLILIFVLSVVVLMLPIISRAYRNALLEQTVEKPPNKSIIDIWQLDMVEGGKGSRSTFLQSQSKKLKQKYEQTFITVTTHTKSSAEELMSQGIYPDIISFSNGLCGVETKAVQLDFSSPLGGYYNKKLYFAPWAVGGYVLITKPNSENTTCFVSQSDFTQPLIAYYLSSYRYENIEILKPINAYTSFLSNKNACMIGTQRDIFRLIKRGEEFSARPICEFSDIIQYIAITTDDESKLEVCKSFVKILLDLTSEELQSIGMLKPKRTQEELSGELGSFSNFTIENTISCFYGSRELKQLQSFLADSSKNEQEKINRIKNLLQ